MKSVSSFDSARFILFFPPIELGITFSLMYNLIYFKSYSLSSPNILNVLKNLSGINDFSIRYKVFPIKLTS